MGAWSASITGNDTAQDLYADYIAAFYKYSVEEALIKIDNYVRGEMCDESDPEEWCNYYYSLADFMWKKGILTDTVRDKAIEMIDSEFGLELWKEAGEKTLNSRKKVLEAFKAKLLSPLPPKKKIKPSGQLERIFENGDIIAIQLQTAGKPYTQAKIRNISEEEFHALDGKYVIMQLIDCYAEWQSAIVPEVKNYWAVFRLFDGIYDEIPEDIDFSSLKPAVIQQPLFSSEFDCESSMFYFKRRNYKILANRKDLIDGVENPKSNGNSIFFSINKPWNNPDSIIVASMGKEIVYSQLEGTEDQIKDVCAHANRWGRYIYRLSKEENKKIFSEEERLIAERIQAVLSRGGKIYGISFDRLMGIITVENGHLDNLYISRPRNGFGTRLLEYAISCIGGDAYIDVPAENECLLHICEKLGFVKINSEKDNIIHMIKTHSYNQ